MDAQEWMPKVSPARVTLPGSHLFLAFSAI